MSKKHFILFAKQIQELNRLAQRAVERGDLSLADRLAHQAQGAYDAVSAVALDTCPAFDLRRFRDACKA